jgi:hypothetical protein
MVIFGARQSFTMIKSGHPETNEIRQKESTGGGSDNRIDRKPANLGTAVGKAYFLAPLPWDPDRYLGGV